MILRSETTEPNREEREPPRNQGRYFDDEAWPVQLALAGLGGLLIALLARQQSADLSQWPIDAWIVVGVVGVATIAAMISAAFIDPRIVRRPLQLALVLCLIVHAFMVVQMVHARLDTGRNANLVPSRVNHAPTKPIKIADYRPVEHLSEQSRPQQDFERPVDAETRLPTDERDSVTRQLFDRAAPDAAIASSADLDNEAKPEATELERKLLDERPKMTSVEVAEAPRSLTDIRPEVSQSIELPAAVAETQTTLPDVVATRPAVDRQQIPLTAGPRRNEANDLARPPAPLPEVTIDSPTNSRRRIPVYEQPPVSEVSDISSDVSRRASDDGVKQQPLDTIELPAVAEATVRQAISDHQPLASSAARTQVARTPIVSRNSSAGTTTEPVTRASDQPPAAGSPLSSRRSAPATGPAVNPTELAAIARPSRSVAAPAVIRSIVPKEAFSARSARLRDEKHVLPGSRIHESEDAIERGLVFMARYQRPDGRWSLQGFPEGASLVSDTAATALAVMAFQGAGYNHRELAYHDVVSRGLAYLLSRQKENGDLFVPLDDASNKSVWLYSHALATIAVCEAYGMTQDASLREPAQRAIDFIVTAQQQERGGWRYAPGINSDTSVSGWMTMALKSGELAGLSVPASSYAKIAHWLDTAQQSASVPYLYCYNPYAPDSPEQRHGRVTSKTMTAVGLLMRLYTGWRRDDPNFSRGAAYFLTSLPSEGNSRQNERDTYYWYYATQVMAQAGGENWQAWSERLQPLLVRSQVRSGELAGSWDPLLPVADRWGPQAGRLYVTAMNLLSLEVEYRKLPLEE